MKTDFGGIDPSQHYNAVKNIKRGWDILLVLGSMTTSHLGVKWLVPEMTTGATSIILPNSERAEEIAEERVSLSRIGKPCRWSTSFFLG